MKKVELIKAIENNKTRSAWDKAVNEYAIELLEQLDNDYDFVGSPADKKALLNGADSWSQFSYGGCSLIYNGDIAERVCSPSEYKRSKEGERNPNSREEWLDVQTRALTQAASRIIRLAKKMEV
jgi:hypothetical protein